MKKFFIALIGGTVVLIGVVMLVLPGPGTPGHAPCEGRGRESPPQVRPERMAATA